MITVIDGIVVGLRVADDTGIGDTEVAEQEAVVVEHIDGLRADYQTGDQLLDPVDIANVLVFLVSPAAHGVNGNIMFVDGGTDALLNSEKVY